MLFKLDKFVNLNEKTCNLAFSAHVNNIYKISLQKDATEQVFENYISKMNKKNS